MRVCRSQGSLAPAGVEAWAEATHPGGQSCGRRRGCGGRYCRVLAGDARRQGRVGVTVGPCVGVCTRGGQVRVTLRGGGEAGA
jgi:hypothetical protein